MNDRLATIVTAHLDTCQWLFQREEYRAWRDPDALTTDSGFLWLKGKPGAGKSTLMKSAQHYGEQNHRDTIICFFFNARGVELEKSAQGMYRSLLSQLLNKRVEQLAALSKGVGYSRHFQLLEPLLEKTPRRETCSTPQIWPIELLKDMLRDLVLAFSPTQVDRCANTFNESVDVGARETYRKAVDALAQEHVTCYVDALDECDNDDARDMIEFLGSLRVAATEAGAGFRILLTSRHYPHITFNACQELTLAGQKGHEADIAEYIRSKLRIGESNLAREIQTTIQARASGVFLWVVLVIRILNALYDRGQIRRLRQRLDDIPNGLHKLFEEILQRDTQDAEECLLAFQWLIFSRRPLKLEEFYCAVTGAFDLVDDIEACEESNVSADDMRRFLLHASKGLAEMTQGEDPTVQFIHESVRDYLLETGLLALKPSLGTDVVEQSHIQLRNCCCFHIENFPAKLWPLLDRQEAQDSYAARWNILRMVESACPFLVYAVEGLFFHADSAHTPHPSQEDFVAAFPYDLWREVYNLTRPKYRLSISASPLYMLMMMDAPKLAEIYINTRGVPPQSPDRPRELHRSLLGLAIAKSNHHTVSALLDHGVGANWPAIHNHTCLSLAISNGYAHIVQILVDAGAIAEPLMSGLRGSPKLGPSLQLASEEIVLKILTSDVYTARWHEDFNWILYGMRQNRRPEAEQILISRLENIVSEASVGRAVPPYADAALLAACIQNRPDLIAPLARNSADPDVRHVSNESGLVIAIIRYPPRAVRVLLELGADPNVPDGLGDYPVHRAARMGSVDIMSELLDHGADPYALDGHGDSALVAASIGGYLSIVYMLLQAGDPMPTELDKAALRAWEIGLITTVEQLVLEGAKQPGIAPHSGSTDGKSQ
jgi:ankyrin repeat protein